MGRERSAKMWFPEKSSWVWKRRLECELYCRGYPAQRQGDRSLSPGHGLMRERDGMCGMCLWGSSEQHWVHFFWTLTVSAAHMFQSMEKNIFKVTYQQMCAVRAKSVQSRPTLCDPMGCSPPDSSVHWILQARMLEWVAMPFSRGSSWLSDRTQPAFEPRFLTFPAFGDEFFFFLISWRLNTLQCCSGFCHTLTWISLGYTCIPHPNPPSHPPLYPIPLGLPSAPGLSTCLMHPTWAGDLFHSR